MKQAYFIAKDLAKVYAQPDRAGLRAVLEWGDTVWLDPDQDITDDWLRVEFRGYTEHSDHSIAPMPTSGYIVPPKNTRPRDVVKPRSERDILKISFVDVQQGDATLIEVPNGEEDQVILVDGGENQLLARFLAARYRGTTPSQPKPIDCIVVTHGDSDHLVGLGRILESETYRLDTAPASDWMWKRLHIAPARVYHNGLVKRDPPPKGLEHPRPESECFGATEEVAGHPVVVELHDNLLDVPDDDMDGNFRAWKRTLGIYNDRALNQGRPPIEMRRLAKGDTDAFDFLPRGPKPVRIEVLGPLVTTTPAGKTGLPFLGKPSEDRGTGHPGTNPAGRHFSGISASHTINGHSVVLRLSYGRFSLLLGGDLNEQAQRELCKEHEQHQGNPEQGVNLRSEVLKVPHHGSRDFSPRFLDAVSPLVSVVSSGDEKASKDYIHPRATLMTALGRHSRNEDAVLFVTEMVAFFSAEGYVTPEQHAPVHGNLRDLPPSDRKPAFFAFSRKAFGLVKVRTDGERMLVWTDSAQLRMKESYAFTAAVDGTWAAVPVEQV